MFPIINLGPLSMPASGLILLLGFWLGSLLAERKSKLFKVNPNLVEKVLWACLLSGLIGARLAYIARHPSAFQEILLSVFSLNPNLLDPIGGLLISATVGFVYISHQRISLWVFLDSLTPFFAVMAIALSFSNFASGTGFGTSTTLPWGISLWGDLRHPVQIYYFLGGLVTLFIILIRKQINEHQSGFSFLLFVSLTSGFRLFFSGFQETASLVGGGLRIPQLIFWTILAISLSLLNKHKLPLQMVKPYESQG